ncbi:MAG: hypothetical protein ACTHMH_05390 [Curtobacterium sp.]
MFLDENVSHLYANSLRPLVKIATLSSAFEERLAGVKDIELFAALQARGFHGIVTLDRHQLEHEDELDALRASGLHWIGLGNPQGRGLQVHGQMLSTLMFAVPMIVRTWPAVPHRHHVPLVASRYAPTPVSAPL